MKNGKGEEMSKDEIENLERAMKDKTYWEGMAPKGYRLMGFTYRQGATFSCPGDRHSINIESSHFDFFLGEHK